MEIIETNAVTKRYGATTALNNISLQVNQGDIYGFLGLNGAGKTTLIRTLLGMIKPDSGSINLFNQPLTPAFNRWNDVGYLVETPYAYPNLTIVDNLKVALSLRGLKDENLITEIIEKLKLTPYAYVKTKNLSLGNKQRLGLAKAMMHKPKLLILDEPVNGLDPEGIVEIRQMLTGLCNQGSTIFLSSHLLGEIYKLANRFAIIHNGRLIKELNHDTLQKQLEKKLIIHTADNNAAATHLAIMGYNAIHTPAEITLTDERAIKNPSFITQTLTEKGLPPAQVYVWTEDLEQYFLKTIRTSV